MTTVIYQKANALFCLYPLFDRHAELDSHQRQHLFARRMAVSAPPSIPLVDEPHTEMAKSKYYARVVALRKMGYPVRIVSIGVRVDGFVGNVPSARVLGRSDVIERVNGVRVRSLVQMRKLLAGCTGGATVHVEFRRGSQLKSGSFALINFRGLALMGIIAQDALEVSHLPVRIRIATHNVRGASAGLMFTLEIIDQMTPGGITRGRRIAGTGTIDLDGIVGPIEGADLKMVAAHRVGARMFFVPVENYPEIRNLYPDMKVIPVRTIDDALHALRQLH